MKLMKNEVDIDGVVYSAAQDVLLRYPEAAEAETFTVPEGVKEIALDAFYGNAHLKHIELPSTLKSIGAKAFTLCTYLEEITIPNGVELIGAFAFHGCHRLAKVKLSRTVKRLCDCAFADCESLLSLGLPAGVELGEDVFDDTPVITYNLPETWGV